MYAVERDPEHPGDGVWREPIVRAGPEPQGLGPPLVLRITPDLGDPWIVWIESAGHGRLRAVQPAPALDRLAVVVDGLAYLVPTDRPAGPEEVVDQVQQVVPVDDPPRLLFVRWSNIVAVGTDGVAWTSPWLSIDALQVIDVEPGAITCLADVCGGRMERIVVDPSSGAQTAGPRLDEVVSRPAPRRRWWRRA